MLAGGHELTADVVLGATGMVWRTLELQGVDELLDRGVYDGAGRSEAGPPSWGIVVTPRGSRFGRMTRMTNCVAQTQMVIHVMQNQPRGRGRGAGGDELLRLSGVGAGTRSVRAPDVERIAPGWGGIHWRRAGISLLAPALSARSNGGRRRSPKWQVAFGISAAILDRDSTHRPDQGGSVRRFWESDELCAQLREFLRPAIAPEEDQLMRTH